MATGAEFPLASEGGAQCISNTRAGFCWSIRKSGPAPTPEVMERARRHATQLESAMQLLDAGDPTLVPLQEAHKKEKAQASAPLLADRVSASEMCVVRKKKCLEEAEQEIVDAIKRPRCSQKPRSWQGRRDWVESRICRRSPPRLVVATRNAWPDGSSGLGDHHKAATGNWSCGEL